MIIGGESVFLESLPLATRLYLTFIHHRFTGDTFFPRWDASEWGEISRQDFSADTHNAYSFSFVLLERRQGTLNT
jgi:dihydrofolate reductase